MLWKPNFLTERSPLKGKAAFLDGSIVFFLKKIKRSNRSIVNTELQDHEYLFIKCTQCSSDQILSCTLSRARPPSSLEEVRLLLLGPNKSTSEFEMLLQICATLAAEL